MTLLCNNEPQKTMQLRWYRISSSGWFLPQNLPREARNLEDESVSFQQVSLLSLAPFNLWSTHVKSHSFLDVPKLENSMRRHLLELLTVKCRAIFFFFFFEKDTVLSPGTSTEINPKPYRVIGDSSVFLRKSKGTKSLALMQRSRVQQKQLSQCNTYTHSTTRILYTNHAQVFNWHRGTLRGLVFKTITKSLSLTSRDGSSLLEEKVRQWKAHSLPQN